MDAREKAIKELRETFAVWTKELAKEEAESVFESKIQKAVNALDELYLLARENVENASAEYEILSLERFRDEVASMDFESSKKGLAIKLQNNS